MARLKQPAKGHEPMKKGAPPEVRKFQRKLAEGHREARLAFTYINDGALATGAGILHKAADLIQAAHEIRAKALGAPLN